MRTVKYISVILLLALFAYASSIAYKKMQEQKRKSNQPLVEKHPLKVKTMTVRAGTLNRSINLTAEIEPIAIADIIPKVGGILERLRLPNGTLIEEGTRIKKGQLIAVIEHKALDAAVLSANAALETAKINAKEEIIDASIQGAEAAYAAAKAQLGELDKNIANLKREMDRTIELFEKGNASESMRDRAVTAYQSLLEKRKSVEEMITQAESTAKLVRAQARALAEARVAQAQAALEQARVALNEATIEAPVTGIVSRKYIDEGDMAGPARPLLRIVAIDTVKISAGVNERYLSKLKQGSTIGLISVSAYPDEVFRGKLHRIGIDVNRRTRTIPIELRLDNPKHRLHPGMFASLKLILDKHKNVTVIPDDALVREEGLVYTFVIDGNTAHRRRLTLGISDRALHEVLDGITIGDVIVTSGQHLLREGDEIAIAKDGAK